MSTLFTRVVGYEVNEDMNLPIYYCRFYSHIRKPKRIEKVTQGHGKEVIMKHSSPRCARCGYREYLGEVSEAMNSRVLLMVACIQPHQKTQNESNEQLNSVAAEISDVLKKKKKIIPYASH